MNKWIIRIVALLMAGCIVLGLVSMVFAQESDTDETVSEETTSEETISTEPVYEEVSIDSLEDFLAFARDCRLDSFSQNKIFYLNADIDLTGTQFESIPIFCGSFVGNGHSISGLQLTAAGSAQGLFRYLTETAKVQDLSVSGSVAPGGSANQVGGIAGVNYGRIENCTFSGEVTGTNQVGGIAGLNEIGAFIENCSVSGSLSGSHIAGGIAGENKGTIRTCDNTAAINTTQQQNRVDISDITLDTITGSETTITVTDIGGIAGASSGDIANCVNRGDVGYPYMGYNVGGIAEIGRAHV